MRLQIYDRIVRGLTDVLNIEKNLGALRVLVGKGLYIILADSG